MQVPPEQPKAPLIERRQAERRRRDALESAYNEGGKAPPLEVAKGVVLYLAMLWVAFTAVIGSYAVFKWLWNAVRHSL